RGARGARHQPCGRPRAQSRARPCRACGEICRPLGLILGLIEQTALRGSKTCALESRETIMADAATRPKPVTTTADEAQQELTDGFHLVIDALKLNGINTIYGVPGIPITDLGRKAQAAGMRVLSFRHEQNAGNAAAIAGFLTKKPGICLTVSAPGFLNGLTALANATTNCFPM